MATKWGIISAGKICGDFCAALGSLDPKEHQIVAVAARELRRAEEFAQKHGIPRAYGHYDLIAKNEEIGEFLGDFWGILGVGGRFGTFLSVIGGF